MVTAAVYRRLTWRSVVRSMLETAKISVAILFIICASITFSQILVFSGATQGMLDLIRLTDLSAMSIVLFMLAVLLFLGAFMDQVSMMMVTLPFFMPLVQTMAIDPIWFGVLMLVMLEVGFTTPPFGLLLFVMKGVAPPDITMRQICLAAAPFIALMLATVGFVLAFPPLATWLPGYLGR